MSLQQINDESAFWERAAREGLPWFRFLRRSLSVAELDQRFAGSRIESDYLALRAQMQPGDQWWPFEFHVRKYLGMRSGFILLRRGKPVGGVVTIVS